MASRPDEIPALESGTSGGLSTGMSLPTGMTRRALSYDDALDAPLGSPPSDISGNVIWMKPVIPERKFQRLAKEAEAESFMSHAASFDGAVAKNSVSVVKAKASAVIMSSLMTIHTQDSIQKFEQHAGLTDAVYTPHKGLTAEETRYHRVSEKLKVPGGDSKEGRKATSAPPTPSITPRIITHTSPNLNCRSWFSHSSTAFFTSSQSGSLITSTEMGGNEGGGGSFDRWSFFGSRPLVQKSSTDPGGLSLQSHQGGQNTTTMEAMKTHVTRMAESPANLSAPKLEITSLEGKRQMPRPHKLKPRDMNVLTPSGF
ncbi:putative monooxygenase p33MONOX [Scleropages formosus]|uniref:Putative monooxygenase p33MONOX n=1 Tax=Scleropages formosus TaxID=113540 RepID=A0A8C9RV63_SCLFO|nr:putative monooxygenase p33MONOX [Scleropages formosus]XP_018611820.1 putative monooxygenase p33MONOX [Scleropages formosus]XP_018611821.1 putative monooxygenase p33MONOX [Scleropages formosus]XP_029113529.1 putative monooxygenase p33MONOX [Scleropages formosus]